MFRMIIDGPRSAAWNMSFDEAILEARINNVVPDTIRIYFFSPSAVTIGYFQKINEVVHMEETLSRRIDVVRRPTGGGAVFHDELGELTYSIVASEKIVGKDVIESYKRICEAVIEALKTLGLAAEYKPINDIVVNGKKVSGNAQLRRKGFVLQHGTVMYNTRLDLISKILKIPKLKRLEKDKVKAGLTTVSRELGRRVTFIGVLDAMIKGFKRAFGRLEGGTYTSYELAVARKLYLEKYSSEQWNMRK